MLNAIVETAEIEAFYQMKRQKYINQGIAVDESLDDMLLREAVQQYTFMGYVNSQSKKNKKEVVEWQHQAR